MSEPRQQLVITRDGDIVIAALQHGHLRPGDAEALRAELNQLLEHPQTKHVVLDFRNVHICCALLNNEVVRLQRQQKARGNRLSLCGSASVLEHLTRLKFDRLLPIVANLQEAIVALRISQDESSPEEQLS